MDSNEFLIRQRALWEFITQSERERQRRNYQQENNAPQPASARIGLRQRLGLILIDWGERLSESSRPPLGSN